MERYFSYRRRLTRWSMALIQFANPPDVHQRLRALSVILGRPLTALVAQAVAEFVEREKHRIEDFGKLVNPESAPLVERATWRSQYARWGRYCSCTPCPVNTNRRSAQDLRMHGLTSNPSASPDRVLAVQTGSFHEGSVRVVRDVAVNHMLLRHAGALLAIDAAGEPIVVHRTSPAGVVRLHALRTERKLLLRSFAHLDGTRAPLGEYERYGTCAAGVSPPLTHDEHGDEVHALLERQSS